MQTSTRLRRPWKAESLPKQGARTAWNLGAAVVLRRDGKLKQSVDILLQLIGQKSVSLRSRIACHLELGKAYDLLGHRRDAQAEYRRVMVLDDSPSNRDLARRLIMRRYQGL